MILYEQFYTIYTIWSKGAKIFTRFMFIVTFKVYGKILTTLLTTFSQFINHFPLVSLSFTLPYLALLPLAKSFTSSFWITALEASTIQLLNVI